MKRRDNSVHLVTWAAVTALAEVNPSARVIATGSGMSVTLPDGSTFVGIRGAA